MQLKFFCPRWGSEDIPWDTFCLNVKKAGYDGIEFSIPLDPGLKNEILSIIKSYDLLIIGQYYQSFESAFEIHKKNFIKHLENTADASPVLIDSQTGKDYFDSGQNNELFSIAERIASQTGVQIAHETHRNKALFAAHITKQFLLKNAGLRLTADFSH